MAYTAFEQKETMRIGIIFYGIYPFNRGIDQLAQLLNHLGHQVTIVAKLPVGGKRVRQVQGIPVIQLPIENRYRISSIVYFHFPLNPFWLEMLVRIGRSKRWDAIIVRESPLAVPVLLAAKCLGIPAYIDMREDLTAMYQMGKARNKALALFRSKGFVGFYENKTLNRFAHVFTVSKEMKEWLMHSYMLNGKFVSVLENTPSEYFLKEASQALSEKRPKNDVVRLVYAGSIKKSKGIGDVVACLPEVIAKIPRIRLRIIGNGPYLNELKEEVKENALQERVEFLPMLSMSDLVRALSECDLGLETSELNDLTNKTIPGKLFEYMALGLPVLSSKRKSVMRVITEVGCGQIYHVREAGILSQSILEMVTDTARLRKMGQNGRKAVIERYNWKSNLGVLLKEF